MSEHPEFPLGDDLIYLNHAGVSPWPRCTARAIAVFAEENVTRGAARYPEWLKREAALRDRLVRLIGAAAPSDVAFIKNTSEGLSFIAGGLAWKSGDQVLINRAEFPSNRIVWESLRDQGVETVDVNLAAGASPEDSLIDAMTPRTRLLTVSSVQYGSGLRMDLAKLADACRAHGVLFCVDAIQTLGALRFDLSAVDADFVVADGHKWMLGPEGLGVFWVRPELRDQLRPTQFGWRMVANAGDYDRKDWEIAPDARRYEPGSPNMLGIHGLAASLSLLQDSEGMASVERKVLRNSEYLIEKIKQKTVLELVTDPAEERRSGIVTFRPRRGDGKALHRALVDAGVICASRSGGVRFSPHFYTPEDKLDAAVQMAAEFAGRP